MSRQLFSSFFFHRIVSYGSSAKGKKKPPEEKEKHLVTQNVIETPFTSLRRIEGTTEWRSD